jgi:hypothetical protein
MSTANALTASTATAFAMKALLNDICSAAVSATGLHQPLYREPLVPFLSHGRFAAGEKAGAARRLPDAAAARPWLSA